MRLAPAGALLVLAALVLVAGGLVVPAGADAGWTGADGPTAVADADATAAPGITGATTRDAGAAPRADSGGTTSQDGGTDGSQDPAPAEVRAAVASGDRLLGPCVDDPANHSATRNGSGSDGSSDADAIGRVNGTPYDAELGINDSDALSAAELRAVVERTAARVEVLRCHDFETVPPVEVVNRSTMAARQRAALSDRSAAAERFDDARLEATLLAATGDDPTEVRAATRGDAVRASYDTANGTITLLGEVDSAGEDVGGSTDEEGGGSSGDGTGDSTPGGSDGGGDGSDGATDGGEPVRVPAAAIDEATLAHELVHALQDQQFDLSGYDARRTDDALAESALIEGDAVVVEQWYEDRCDDGWTEPCLAADPPEGTGAGNVGLNLLLLQPRNDGPGFVERRFEAGGWAAVDRLYDDPPRSTYQVMFPSSYEGFERPRVPVNETDSANWSRIRPPDAPDSDVVGPGALAATMMAPTFEPADSYVYPPESIQPSRGGGRSLDRYQFYDYRVDVTRHWRSDRLIAYAGDDGGTASVWRSAWASPERADRFELRYRQLLDERGARPHGSLADTYVFDGPGNYDGAVYLRTEGRHVAVVHAPDVDALYEVYPDAVRESGDGTHPGSAGFGPGGEVPADELSGPTLLAAALVVLSVAAALRHRGRSG